MDIQNELLRSIEMLVSNAVANLQNNDVAGIVTSINGGGKYTVTINGAEYIMKDGVKCSPSVGTAVWCRVPNGDWKNIYIEGIK